MTQWGGAPRSPTAPDSPTTADSKTKNEASGFQADDTNVKSATASPNPARKSQPESMSFQAPVMDLSLETPPEMQPIFSYLNGHANKLYQEGYFLKLHDLDSRK